MAQLPPINFGFPPIRYSPIQEAFRGALDTAMAQWFSQPFEKAAKRRELELWRTETAERPLIEEQAQENLGTIIPVTDEKQLGILGSHGVSPAHVDASGIAHYKQSDIKEVQRLMSPVPADTAPFLKKFADRYGLDLGKTSLSREGLATLQPMIEEDTRLTEQRTEFERSRKDALLAQIGTPDYEFMKSYAYVDPKTGQARRFMPNEAAALGNNFRIKAIAQDAALMSDPKTRAYINNAIALGDSLATGMTPIVGGIIPIDPVAFTQEVTGLKSATAGSEAALWQRIQGLAMAADQAGVLIDAAGHIVHYDPKNPERATSVLQGNEPLLAAVAAAHYYFNSPEEIQQAANVGMLPPALRGKQAQQYLAKLLTPQAPPAAGLPTGPRQAPLPVGAKQPPPPNIAPTAAEAGLGVIGAPARQLVYSTVLNRIKADPTGVAWRAARDTVEGLFASKDSDAILGEFKSWASDPASGLSPDQRANLVRQISIVDGYPAAMKATLLSDLQWSFRHGLEQARQTAGRFTVGEILPEVKPEEKPAGEKKKP